MTLEQQVCSLELAKKLKELGVKQESLFYWIILDSGFERLVLAEATLREGVEGYSAFTVAELGEMLPGRKEQNGIIVWAQSHKNVDGGWTVKAMKKDVRETKTENLHFAVEVGDTEADARAKMLVYLVENYLINCSNEN